MQLAVEVLKSTMLVLPSMAQHWSWDKLFGKSTGLFEIHFKKPRFFRI